MLVVKNTYGVSISYHQRINIEALEKFGGSSIGRKKYYQKEKTKEEELKALKKKLESKRETIVRSMSQRTKSKIRTKIIAFAQVHKKLTFLTLTFVNKVEDKQAVKVLKTFLDNATKRFTDFQYLWVAEKQTNNETFKDNIHFHIITNKYWTLDKWWNYWLSIQAKHNILPREEHFKPGSAFNVRQIKASNTKSIGTYLTKYVTKNASKFDCQVWNCSKKISRLYTCFYSGMESIRKFERLEEAGLLDGKIRTYHQDYCDINVIPINALVMKMYEPIDNKNKECWKSEPELTLHPQINLS